MSFSSQGVLYVPHKGACLEASSFWLPVDFTKRCRARVSEEMSLCWWVRLGDEGQLGVIIDRYEQQWHGPHGKLRHLGLGWEVRVVADRRKCIFFFFFFYRIWGRGNRSGVLCQSLKLEPVVPALFIDVSVSRISSECWRKTLRSSSLQSISVEVKLGGLIKLGIECIGNKRKTRSKSRKLRPADVLMFVADQNSASYRPRLQHLFLAGALGSVSCLMLLGGGRNELIWPATVFGAKSCFWQWSFPLNCISRSTVNSPLRILLKAKNWGS